MRSTWYFLAVLHPALVLVDAKVIWKTMNSSCWSESGREMAEKTEIIIVGGGPAGYAAALYGASAGLGATLVEQEKVGGTCLHRGCIPAKAFLETASVRRTVAHAALFGVQAAESGFDFAVTQHRKQGIVGTLHKGLSGLLKRRGINVVSGRGQLGANKTVHVEGGGSLTADHVILATGSVPRTIPGFEIDGERIVTSDDVLSWETLPRRVAVVGGGAIGCEFASMLSDCGVEVTLLEALPKILALCDHDVAAVVERSFVQRGIKIHTGITDLSRTLDEGGVKLTWNEGEARRDVEVDVVVMSVGRRPNTDDLFVDDTGVRRSDKGFVEVDRQLHTGVDGIWAIGDVIATPQLAHVGFAEGMNVIKAILGEAPSPIDYANVPWCVYTHPELAYAGLTEQAAREQGFDIVVKKDPFAGNGRAMIVGETEGLVKVIAEKRPDGTAGRLLGVHMAGPWVTEQLGQGYLAVNWEATPEDIAPFIQPHPSLAEVFGETVIAMTGRGLHVG